MGGKKYKLIVSDRAKTMFGAHIKFISQVNKSAATKQKEKITEALKSLKESPHRHPFADDEYLLANKYHRMFVEKRYLVLYQVKDDTVYVDYILDCRQDYGWLTR